MVKLQRTSILLKRFVNCSTISALPTSCLLLDFYYLLHLRLVSWTHGRSSTSGRRRKHPIQKGRELTRASTSLRGQIVEVGESRNGAGQVHQQGEGGGGARCRLIFEFLSLTHFLLNVVDFYSRPLSVNSWVSNDAGFKDSDKLLLTPNSLGPVLFSLR